MIVFVGFRSSRMSQTRHIVNGVAKGFICASKLTDRLKTLNPSVEGLVFSSKRIVKANMRTDQVNGLRIKCR